MNLRIVVYADGEVEEDIPCDGYFLGYFREPGIGTIIRRLSGAHVMCGLDELAEQVLELSSTPTDEKEIN